MHSPAHRIVLATATAFLASIAVFGLSGCGSKPTKAEAIERYSDELRRAVSANVSDEPRRTRILAAVERLESLQLHFNQLTASFVAGYRELNAGYDSTRAAFEQQFADYRAERIRMRSEALDLHFEMASAATTDEWNAIGRAEAQLYEKVTSARAAGEAGK